MESIVYIVLTVLLIVILVIIAKYNKLVKLFNKMKKAKSDIEICLNKRFDLMPNLVETVKGYAKHEEGTLTAVIEARNKLNTANNINEEIEANNMLTGALNKLFALAESYPDLKANANFMSLQNDLKDTEDKISYARQFYNDTVLTYNNLREMFPSNIVASIFKFEAFEFFKADEPSKEAPKVKF